MKKLIISLILVGACHSTPPVTTSRLSVGGQPNSASGQIGAADPTTAVRGFLAAAKATDLRAMSALWGDQDALARDRFSTDELQKRELYVMRCLRHDSFDIIGDAPSLNGSREMVVQMSLGELTRSANFEVVRGPENRWYVRDVDVKALQDICMQRS